MTTDVRMRDDLPALDHQRSGKVVVALHDGFYGCASGSAFSNRAFVEILARVLPPGRLVVCPVHMTPSDGGFDPPWASHMSRVTAETSTDVVPVRASGQSPRSLAAHQGLCESVAETACDVLASAARGQLIALDFPFLGIAPHLKDSRTGLLLLPRSTTRLDAPHDRPRIAWERSGIDAAVERGGQVAAISRHMRAHLESEYAVPSSALVDVPNGLDLRADRMSGAPLPLPMPARDGFLLSLGRAVESKGFEDLLRAMVILREHGVRVPHLLLVAGTHTRFPNRHQGRLKAMIDEFGIDATFLPHFASAYRSWLRSPALCAVVVPSRTEPFGRIPLEAFAAGAAPVVATQVGGLAETVLDDRTGYTAAPRDPASLAVAIRRALAADPVEVDRLRRAGRSLLLSRHDYDATVRAYVQDHLAWALAPARSGGETT